MSKKEEILHKLSTEDRNYIKEKFKEKRFVIQVDPLEIEDDSIFDNKELRLYECQSDMMFDICSLLNKQDQQIADLEAKLAEYQNDRVGDANIKLKQSQNQTAIRELEKVKRFLLEKIAEKQSCFDSGNYNDFADGVKTICELILISIDNQIKSLKGEK